MDTLGPRIMVNVGTQAVSNTGLNPRDLAPLTNDAFLATFMGKTSLSASNGISRQHNNYRQSYTTQMERVTIRSKSRPSTSNGDTIEPDSAILSIIRGNGLDNNQQQTSQRQLQGNRNYRRPFNQQQQQLMSGWNDIPCSPNYRPTNNSNRRRRTRSGGAQQQITVVDQMAAQPHIPYAILPKRFEPKQISTNSLQQQQPRSLNNNNNNRPRRSVAPRRSQRQQGYYDNQWEDIEDDDVWPESMTYRRPNRTFGRTTAYQGPRERLNDYYDSYSYGPMSRQRQVPIRSHRRMMYQDDGYIPFDIVPSYDLNEWQGPYARSRQSLYSQQQRSGFRYGRNDNGFIHDDHRVNNSSKQARNNNKPLTPTRNGKQTKSPRNNKGQQKRHNSRQRKQRNQNSKSEDKLATNTNELKSSTTTENETTNEDKEKQETTTTTTTETEEKPIPSCDNENKEIDDEKQTE
ncbi:unnamed protein product [Rotaria sordida]|uniref:Uncharacterized protein n=1 Tax=Rotaria sordida TaxID=392033 RepID=A0A815AAP9_9BILA|nr:unnamed protein product [Rotaria sordida]CAF1153566.1 unnamed protein product [Rotaria sordida]CAF1254924.1 unnamed protein product [Rotaria sordida]CAF3882672.1 unnamed protein product [Rotaria sordida]